MEKTAFGVRTSTLLTSETGLEVLLALLVALEHDQAAQVAFLVGEVSRARLDVVVATDQEPVLFKRVDAQDKPLLLLFIYLDDVEVLRVLRGVNLKFRLAVLAADGHLHLVPGE